MLSSAPLGAHQQKAALTTLRYNPRSNEVEIAHRFALHDAEHAAPEVTGGMRSFARTRRGSGPLLATSTAPSA